MTKPKKPSERIEEIAKDIQGARRLEGYIYPLNDCRAEAIEIWLDEQHDLSTKE